MLQKLLAITGRLIPFIKTIIALMLKSQSLRHIRHIATLAMLMFVLSIGVAVLNPLIQPQSLDVICTSAGQTKILFDRHGGAPVKAHALDCVACLPGATPPLADVPAFTRRADLAYSHPSETYDQPFERMVERVLARGPPLV